MNKIVLLLSLTNYVLSSNTQSEIVNTFSLIPLLLGITSTCILSKTHLRLLDFIQIIYLFS